MVKLSQINTRIVVCNTEYEEVQNGSCQECYKTGKKRLTFKENGGLQRMKSLDDNKCS